MGSSCRGSLRVVTFTNFTVPRAVQKPFRKRIFGSWCMSEQTLRAHLPSFTRTATSWEMSITATCASDQQTGLLCSSTATHFRSEPDQMSSRVMSVSPSSLHPSFKGDRFEGLSGQPIMTGSGSPLSCSTSSIWAATRLQVDTLARAICPLKKRSRSTGSLIARTAERIGWSALPTRSH